MTSESMFINSTNFAETKHKLVANDGRPIKARAAIMGLPDNRMSPGRHQTIIWTNDGILLIWPIGTVKF